MQYIKLEDVVRIIDEQPLRANQSSLLVELFNKINSLPSIDQEEIIENVIAKLVKEEWFSPNWCMVSYFRELLKEFNS